MFHNPNFLNSGPSFTKFTRNDHQSVVIKTCGMRSKLTRLTGCHDQTTILVLESSQVNPNSLNFWRNFTKISRNDHQSVVIKSRCSWPKSDHSTVRCNQATIERKFSYKVISNHPFCPEFSLKFHQNFTKWFSIRGDQIDI